LFITLDLDFSQQVVHSVENASEHDSLGKRSLDRPFTKFYHSKVTADSSGGRSVGVVGVTDTATAVTATTTASAAAAATSTDGVPIRATSRGSRRSRKRKVKDVSPQDDKEEEEEDA